MATKRDLSPSKWNKVEGCLTYLAARSEYMRYDEYLAAGYPIGSGVVEGACRHLVKDRMEKAGMRLANRRCPGDSQPTRDLRQR